ALPVGCREWDPARKRWLVAAIVVDDLLEYLEDAGVDVLDDRPPPPVPRPPMPVELQTAFDTLYLQYTAPLCVADAAYRALSKYFHPDKGGDAHDFNRVASAIKTVRFHLDPANQREEPIHDDDIPF